MQNMKTRPHYYARVLVIRVDGTSLVLVAPRLSDTAHLFDRLKYTFPTHQEQIWMFSLDFAI